MSQQVKTALSVLVALALAGAFWLLLLSPKREKADELSKQVNTLQAEVASEKQRAETAAAAKKDFPGNYRELIVLGKAVPAEAATPSLLVQLNGVSARAETSFRSISLGGEGGSGSGGSAPATESGAALLPLGASVGPAGFAAMPYSLDFEGGYFDIADFIHGLDGLVKTEDGEVDAKGRLVTIDGFNLTPVSAQGGGQQGKGSATTLAANFSVTTYVTPPGQGLTAGATATGPAETTPNLP